MNLDEQISVVKNVIDDLKGEDIVALDVMSQCVDMETIIIATGRSMQHVRGIANNVVMEAKRLNMIVLGTEAVSYTHLTLPTKRIV